MIMQTLIIHSRTTLPFDSSTVGAMPCHDAIYDAIHDASYQTRRPHVPAAPVIIVNISYNGFKHPQLISNNSAAKETRGMA